MTTTELITSLKELALACNSQQIPDTVLREAAERLEMLELAVSLGGEKIANLMRDLHDARLENSGQAARIERTRPEPSRLEIAAMIYAGVDCDDIGCAFDAADELIAAAKAGK
jgi:hypothetical protein